MSNDAVGYSLPVAPPLRFLKEYGEDVELRCCFCGALLATTEPEGLRVHRSQLEVLVGGADNATFVCYRPGCRRLNRFDMVGRWGR